MTDPARLAAIADAYRDGMRIQDIKAHFHTSARAIRNAKDAYGLPDRPRGYPAGQPKRRRQKRDKRPRCKVCKIVLTESPDELYPGPVVGDYCNYCRAEYPGLVAKKKEAA